MAVRRASEFGLVNNPDALCPVPTFVGLGEPYVSVTIAGYTDRLGSDEYNVELSQRRANAVKSYLVGKGVAADRLIAVGKGKVDPIVHCDNSARSALIKCLEPNRRVVIEPITVERRVG